MWLVIDWVRSRQPGASVNAGSSARACRTCRRGGGLQTCAPRMPEDSSQGRDAMAQISHLKGVTAPLLAKMLTIAALGPLASSPLRSAAAEAVTPRTDPKPQPDLSGRERTGVASFYADRFAGRKMADGNKMAPQGSNAASRTLPLGTVAKVTNLATRKSAVVTIQDR